MSRERKTVAGPQKLAILRRYLVEKEKRNFAEGNEMQIMSNVNEDDER